MAILLFYFSSSHNIGHEQKRKRDSSGTIDEPPARRVLRKKINRREHSAISTGRSECQNLEKLEGFLVGELLGISSAVNRRIARLELGRYIYDVILKISRERLSDSDSDSGSVSRVTENAAISEIEGDDDEYVRNFARNMVEEIKRIPNDLDRERVRLKVIGYIIKKKSSLLEEMERHSNDAAVNATVISWLRACHKIENDNDSAIEQELKQAEKRVNTD